MGLLVEECTGQELPSYRSDYFIRSSVSQKRGKVGNDHFFHSPYLAARRLEVR